MKFAQRASYHASFNIKRGNFSNFISLLAEGSLSLRKPTINLRVALIYLKVIEIIYIKNI